MTLYDESELILNLNHGKHVLLRKLYEDGVISEVQFNTYNYDYGIIVLEKNWFKKLKDNLSSSQNKIAAVVKLL